MVAEDVPVFSTFIVGGVVGHAEKGITERSYAARPDELLLACADRVSEEIAARLGLAPKARRTARK